MTLCYATAAHAHDHPTEATTTVTGSSYGHAWSLPACDKHAA